MTAVRSMLREFSGVRFWISALTALLFVAPIASAQPQPKARPDLANIAAGTYHGEVISDARGESRSDVDITVVKIAPNTVRVSSDYARLPSFVVRLTRAMNTIQQASGDNVFLLDLSKRPSDLHVTVDDAAWQGVKGEGGGAAAPPAPVAVKPDLADIAAGTYTGDVISDARGSSQSDVTITVTKVGPNQVEISSDYARLPRFTTRLTRALNTIQQSSGNNVFLLDLSKRPAGLDITVDDASWSGAKSQ